MKILLIDPPFYRFIGYYNRYFPLGLSYLAAVLQKEGYEVKVYDADCNVNPTKMDYSRLENDYSAYLKSVQDDNHPIWREMRQRISNFKPDVVAITVWTNFAASAFKIASICKEYDKDLPVVMGGPHVSVKYDEVMKICSHVDFLVRGEGEETFLELTSVIKKHGNAAKKDRFSQDLSLVKGISYRCNGQIVTNPPREFIKDLDSIPLPVRELLLNKDYYNSEDMGLLMTSRGCPYNCSYCATAVWKRKIRYRSINNIIEEIKLVKDVYGTSQFTFKDDSFTVSRKRVIQLCDRLIAENIHINWDCNTRVNLVDEELLTKMKAAGCNGIKVGIETGSEKILKLMNKNITLGQCRKAAGLFKKAGIYWTGYFMMGLPSETKGEVYETLRFMKELKPDFASLSVYEPFPGTDLFEAGIERGLVQNERTLDDFYNISPKYYYIKDINRRVDTMSNDEFVKLEAEMKRKFHKYNMGFSRILKRGVSRSNLYLSEPKALWADLKKLRSWVG
jgi:radical SAM superfamily enzyme YgiQ (UPF0313 family)